MNLTKNCNNSQPKITRLIQHTTSIYCFKTTTSSNNKLKKIKLKFKSMIRDQLSLPTTRKEADFHNKSSTHLQKDK